MHTSARKTGYLAKKEIHHVWLLYVDRDLINLQGGIFSMHMYVSALFNDIAF